ncbi:MAG: helix-turn-helix domain-containing protein [Nitrososphaera sp.]
MKAAYIVSDHEVARVLIDPMRRAILGFLREKPMTQSQLADRLGLSDASLNYHMKILMKAGLVNIARREVEEHGIMQKFFAPAAYMFVYDLDALPKDVSRYFYPLSLERARAALALMGKKESAMVRDSKSMNEFAASLSRMLVIVARQYAKKEVAYDSENMAHEIYSKAISMWLAHSLRAPVAKQR